MKKAKIIKRILFVIIQLAMLGVFACNIFFSNLNLSKVSIVFSCSIIVSTLGLCYGYLKSKDVIFKLFIVISFLVVGVYVAYYFANRFGLFQQIDSLKDIKSLILKHREQGIAIFTLINFLQVTFVPLPSSVTILAGTAIFGPFWAFVFASIGVLLGSVLAFFIGRLCSKPLLYWIFCKEKVEKYENLLSGRTRLILFLTLFLPLFPDDLICMLAGITDIKFKDFFFISLFARSFGIACLCYFGSGKIIPFNTGWGIGLWIVIVIVVVVGTIIAYRKRKKIIKIFAKNKD